MAASITIRITEDDSPHGSVTIDKQIEGYDMDGAVVNGDLPPALLLGARMLSLIHEDELPVETDQPGGDGGY